MTIHGVDFLENWIVTNITGDTKPAEAQVLAMRCIVEAAALGITYEGMESKWGSVEQAIMTAINNLPKTPSISQWAAA
jgi:hypothetical protein